ncbi:hypothetical protein GUJ93_ZPchr0006g44275 [Zizania palustris]|uniref:Uncharacterized protein n=1 Tax=Zizania palustris TaxID=103762 RepID=A0A8J5W379_ZIZPA|nr:hypothetical protein GUJ93_ZPchr0006g44275 [Zizania palustris]
MEKLLPCTLQICNQAGQGDKLSMIPGVVVLVTPKVLPAEANSSSPLKTACLHMALLPVSFVSDSKILPVAIDMDDGSSMHLARTRPLIAPTISRCELPDATWSWN